MQRITRVARTVDARRPPGPWLREGMRVLFRDHTEGVVMIVSRTRKRVWVARPDVAGFLAYTLRLNGTWIRQGRRTGNPDVIVPVIMKGGQ